ncbi:hypothetical protein [Pseudomonas frederiksbergensis]|uniref:hypothetical protein n=1 Tax=Pseudomonas frederiksbergensis TaxID=104087 RepID=UPI002855486B|nr:hypothetical protein [Pseudomonas frederiksbergensis]MDR7109217.1 Zn ribbon nucleic-acid-binding protein [Pseudomonas frederiksbergensis]
MKARDDGKAYAQDVTLEEFAAFLHDNEVDGGKCRRCGNGTWQIPKHEDKPVLLSLSTPAHPSGVGAFYVSCSNCGHIEQFLSQTVVSRLMGWH